MHFIHSIGIDIAAKSFRCCYKVKDEHNKVKIKGTRKFSNTKEGIDKFIVWSRSKNKTSETVRVVMEATGVYYERVAYGLHAADFEVYVLLPNRTKAYFKFLNLKSKTDELEADGLSQLGLDACLEQWHPSSSQMYSLKRLCRERTHIMEQKGVFKNRLHAERSCQRPQSQTLERLEQMIALLEQQLKAVEKQIEQQVKLDEELSRKIGQICQIKGLAIVTVATIIAETDGFALISNKAQLVSYSGYDVVERQSGSSIKGKTRISKKGNAHIRRALYFPAINMVKYHEEFTNLYDRIYERSRIKMKGYVAAQRKLLVLIYTLFKNDAVYDPNYWKNHIVQQKNRQDTSPAYTG
ncbi:MAG: IS110 family transposase [Phototrophicaceae bacterium]